MSIAGSASTATLTVNDVKVFDHLIHHPGDCAIGSPAFVVGFTSLDGLMTPWAVRFDHVTFDD